MDLFEIAIRYAILPSKARRSRARADRERPLRRPLPVLGLADNDRPTPELLAAVNTHVGKLAYVPDRLFGLDDDYTHPEASQWSLEHGQPGTPPLPFDCDDLYALAFALLILAGVSPAYVWGWNLIVPLSQQFARVGPQGELGASYNHVILGAEVRKSGLIWTATVTAGTLPSTISPGGATDASASTDIPLIRLDN